MDRAARPQPPVTADFAQVTLDDLPPLTVAVRPAPGRRDPQHHARDARRRDPRALVRDREPAVGPAPHGHRGRSEHGSDDGERRGRRPRDRRRSRITRATSSPASGTAPAPPGVHCGTPATVTVGVGSPIPLSGQLVLSCTPPDSYLAPPLGVGADDPQLLCPGVALSGSHAQRHRADEHHRGRDPLRHRRPWRPHHGLDAERPDGGHPDRIRPRTGWVRPANQAGTAATSPASTNVAGHDQQERQPRDLRFGHRAEIGGEHAPREAPEQRAERQADQQRQRHQRRRLPHQREPHLAPHEAQCLEHRELVAPPADRAQTSVCAKCRGGEEREQRAEHGRKAGDVAELLELTGRPVSRVGTGRARAGGAHVGRDVDPVRGTARGTRSVAPRAAPSRNPAYVRNTPLPRRPVSPNSGKTPRPTTRRPVAVFPRRSTAMSPMCTPARSSVVVPSIISFGGFGSRPSSTVGATTAPWSCWSPSTSTRSSPSSAWVTVPAASAEIVGSCSKARDERGGEVGQGGCAALHAPVPAVEVRGVEEVARLAWNDHSPARSAIVSVTPRTLVQTGTDAEPRPASRANRIPASARGRQRRRGRARGTANGVRCGRSRDVAAADAARTRRARSPTTRARTTMRTEPEDQRVELDPVVELGGARDPDRHERRHGERRPRARRRPRRTR